MNLLKKAVRVYNATPQAGPAEEGAVNQSAAARVELDQGEVLPAVLGRVVRARCDGEVGGLRTLSNRLVAAISEMQEDK